MNILLVGEYSGLHCYLKQGLCELGHHVLLAANGDGYKKIPGADIPLSIPGASGLKGVFDNYLDPLFRASKLQGFDVAQYISPVMYPYRIREYAYRILMNNNTVNSLVAAGSDLALVRAYESGIFDYYIYDNDKSYKDRYYSGSKETKIEKRIIKKADVIIPSLYEYSVGYGLEKKLSQVIPFPINSREIKYEVNRPKDKIVFFHGLNREKKKGTEYILKAFEHLQAAYPNEVEVVAKGHMPLSEYLDVMQKANVVVDQCLSYGYGINACLAMAQGKIVISGCRKETLDAFGIEKTPMLLATPSVDQLYAQMSEIVENREKIPEMGFLSRKYVETVHDHVKVAQRYVDAWQSTGKV